MTPSMKMLSPCMNAISATTEAVVASILQRQGYVGRLRALPERRMAETAKDLGIKKAGMACQCFNEARQEIVQP